MKSVNRGAAFVAIPLSASPAAWVFERPSRWQVLQFAYRGIDLVYVQQEVAGEIVKFYGVGGGEYFSALSESGQPLNDSLKLSLERAARVS